MIVVVSCRLANPHTTQYGERKGLFAKGTIKEYLNQLTAKGLRMDGKRGTTNRQSFLRFKFAEHRVIYWNDIVILSA